VCNLTLLISQGKKQGKITRHFKVTIAVNIKVKLLLLVTLFGLVEGYRIFGDIFSLHLKDILKNVAVFSP